MLNKLIKMTKVHDKISKNKTENAKEKANYKY